MKYINSLILALTLNFAFVSVSSAQLICSLGAHPMQGFYNQYNDQNPTPTAFRETQAIYKSLCPNGCGRFLLVKNNTAPNAMAMKIGPGQTKITYNGDFMDRVAYQFGRG